MFKYEIRNPDIMKDLVAQGFEVVSTSTDCWTVSAPETISSTKARKIISLCIKLFSAAKELSKASKRYKGLVDEINKVNLSR